MADKRLAWLASLTACAIGITSCAATTSTVPQPTPPASSIVVMPKGDLVFVPPSTSSAGTTVPPPPPGVPNTTSAPPPPPGVPNPPVSTDGLGQPAPPILVVPSNIKLPAIPRPSRNVPTTAVPPSTAAVCIPGVSPAPRITSVYPAGDSIQGGANVILSGSNLDLGPGTFVMFGNTRAMPTNITSQSIDVIAPPGGAGTVTIKVQHPGGCSATAQFTYSGPAALAPATSPCPGGSSPPRVNGFSPMKLNPAGGETVTITGQGFATGSGQMAVLFGSAAATITSVTSSQIQVVSPSGSVGAVRVAVASPQGCAVYSQARYELPKPMITSISPNQGPNSGGTVVMITGQNLTNATVKIGGRQAQVNGGSDTSVSITTPGTTNGFSGNVVLVVTTANGIASVPFKYTK